MKFKLGAVAVVLVVALSLVASSAFTSASVARSANVDVVNDDKGLLALSDGTSGPLVYQNGSGALAIDFTKGSGSGVNVESTYVLGNASDAKNHSAFVLTNKGAEAHDITVSYTGAGAGDADDNIKFELFKGKTDTAAATVSEESTSATLSGVQPGTAYYVVVTVDTHGVTNTTDLSGTLTVSA